MSIRATPRRGEDIHHLIIQEIEMRFSELEGARPRTILIAEDEHGTVYRFEFTFQLLDEEEHRPR